MIRKLLIFPRFFAMLFVLFFLYSPLAAQDFSISLAFSGKVSAGGSLPRADSSSAISAAMPSPPSARSAPSRDMKPSTEKTGKAEFSASIRLSTATLKLNQILQVSLFLCYPEGYSVDLEQLTSHLMDYPELEAPPFILENRKIGPKTAKGQEIIFFLMPQRAGNYTLTFRTINFRAIPNGNSPERISKPFQLITDLFPITISYPQSLEKDRAEPFGLLPLDQPIPMMLSLKNRQGLHFTPEQQAEILSIYNKKQLPWLWLFAFIIIGLIIAIIRQYPSHSIVKANHSLHEEQTNLAGAIPLFDTVDQYPPLSLALRRYLAARFAVPAQVLTTEEFLAQMKDLPELETKNLQELLQLIDAVLFAGYFPSEQEKNRMKRIVQQLVLSHQ